MNNAGVSLRDNRTDNRRKRGFDQGNPEHLLILHTAVQMVFFLVLIQKLKLLLVE